MNLIFKVDAQIILKGYSNYRDNVVRKGEIVNAYSDDSNVQEIRHFFNTLALEQQLASTAIQTEGSKGYDGFVKGVVV